MHRSSKARRVRSRFAMVGASMIALAAAAPAFADDPPGGGDPPAASQDWAVHGQVTNIWQYHPEFRSPYQGQNSLDHLEHTNETTDATLFLGLRLWKGAQFWVDPEINQGIAPSGTEGVAGYVNGDGSKVGKVHPYFRIQRAFLRQTFDLGGDSTKVDPDQNVLGGSDTANRVVVTVGKFDVTDIFDDNKYAHDARSDFLNWSVIDAGSFDYAADAWGYSFGSAVEWYQGDWTLRTGLFDLSTQPNGKDLTPWFGQFQVDAEIERRFKLGGHDGKLKITGFMSRGRMGTFADAIALADATNTIPSTGDVRRYQSRFGVSLNLEQEIAKDIGFFARAGVDQGNVEPYEYADIDDTVQAGFSFSGAKWGRKDDTFGVAGVVNEISKIHQEYLNDGGLGILVGDGKLPHPGPEEIVEAYYAVGVVKGITVSFDFQGVENPAYNRDRGPVPVLSARLHGQF